MMGWHFTGDTLRDGSPVPPDGETLRFDGRPILYKQGLHASARLLDALQYATGNTICRVRLGGTINQGDDKAVATQRTIVWRIDGEEILWRFARRCALDVVHLWEAPDVVIRFLQSGDHAMRSADLHATQEAAMEAAMEAAREAAGSAAWSAAWTPAWDAAQEAAQAAARAAAWSAAWTPAWDAAGYADQEAAKAAARFTFGEAAKAAAEKKQNRRLTAMVTRATRRQLK